MVPIESPYATPY